MGPHSILGVSVNATPLEVKTAYRKLAMQTHPDHNHGDDEQFKAVTEAYERLSDTAQRSWAGCSNACGMNNNCSSMWTNPKGERFVWNDRMLPELFAALLAETGDANLQALYEKYVDNTLTRKETLLSIHTYASREQFRQALQTLAERHAREGGMQQVIYA